MIQGYVGRDIRFSGYGADFEALKKTLYENLTWPNPDYSKKQKMGKWLGNTPRELCLVQKAGNDLIVPFGMLNCLESNWSIRYEPSGHIKVCKPVLSPFPVEDMRLYPYQEKAVRWALKARNGVVVAPCGSGKTQMGLAICGALGMRCLWLTHTHELLKQSMNRALSFLPIDKKDVGTITEGKVNAGNFITFATVHTMAKIDLDRFREYWDVIIVDECHKAVGTPTRMTMFWKVISGLSARYKFGLTATPKRGDGMQKAMFALLGKGFHVGRSEVKAATCPLRVNSIRTYWSPDADDWCNPDGTLNYMRLITACITDDLRNQIISDLIESMDGPVMVLSERIEHLERLSKMCSRPNVILSTAKKSERLHTMNDMQDGRIQVLFATYQLAKEGLDIPCLHHLVMASPVKDEITVVQSAGRVMRKYEGKEYGTVWDFEDDMRMLIAWHNKRLKLYRTLEE